MDRWVCDDKTIGILTLDGRNHSSVALIGLNQVSPLNEEYPVATAEG